MFAKLYEKIREKKESLALIGLGYVGMPIAVEFAKRGIKVIGYDRNSAKIRTYQSGWIRLGKLEMKKYDKQQSYLLQMIRSFIKQNFILLLFRLQ